MKLSESARGAIRQFAYWVAAGTVGGDNLLKDITREDYLYIFDEPSACEAAFTIFLNNLEFDEMGRVTNFKHAEYRAAQELRRYLVDEYEVEPPFEDWEVEQPMWQND
jgi:hypothetical protein